MRFFDEEVGRGKSSRETVIVITSEEAHEIVDAITEYCKNHPRKQRAKKLLKEMDLKWGIYEIPKL